jgi:hypothetical protein
MKGKGNALSYIVERKKTNLLKSKIEGIIRTKRGDNEDAKRLQNLKPFFAKQYILRFQEIVNMLVAKGTRRRKKHLSIVPMEHKEFKQQRRMSIDDAHVTYSSPLRGSIIKRKGTKRRTLMKAPSMVEDDPIFDLKPEAQAPTRILTPDPYFLVFEEHDQDDIAQEFYTRYKAQSESNLSFLYTLALIYLLQTFLQFKIWMYGSNSIAVIAARLLAIILFAIFILKRAAIFRQRKLIKNLFLLGLSEMFLVSYIVQSYMFSLTSIEGSITYSLLTLHTFESSLIILFLSLFKYARISIRSDSLGVLPSLSISVCRESGISPGSVARFSWREFQQSPPSST